MDAYLALLVVWMILCVVLVVFSSGAAGRKLADMEIMQLRHVNGVRFIAAWVQLRTHVNRLVMGIAFGVIGILVLSGFGPDVIRFASRIGLVLVLTLFTVSSVLDWLDDRKQLRIVVREYEREHGGPVAPAEE